MSQHNGDPLRVAIDGGPMLGPLTGVGAAVGELITALDARPDVALAPYALSMRGTLRPGMTRLPLPAMIAQRCWAHADIPRLDRRLRPAQVVHGTNYVVGPSRLPRVVTVYDCWFLRNPGQAGAVVRRAGQVLRRAVAGGAAVHTSSHATAGVIREMFATDRVHVVHLAALPRATSSPFAPAPVAELDGLPFVLALGTLERRKNLPRLVAAFGAIAAANPDLRLVLAGGDGDDCDAIETALDALPAAVSDRVVRTGRFDDELKHWLLTNAGVLAYPSLDEGFGFPLLEAMQYDLPVVASTMGSIPEVAGDAALLVDPTDADALAGALQTALTDEPERARLIANGRSRLDAFSWSDTAEQLAELYHHVVEEGR